MINSNEINPVQKRYCIRIKGELDSPLLAGSGEDIVTDMDVILDGKENPFVPGSALAGAVRHYLAAVSDTQAADDLMGNDKRQSRLLVYDVALENARLAQRDGVKLDEYKTAENLGKYEMQIIEPGADYTIRLELVIRKNDIEKNSSAVERRCIESMHTIIGGLLCGEITLGAKSHRGFGRFAVQDIRIRVFNLTDRNECAAWLDWDWERENAFTEQENSLPRFLERAERHYHCLKVPFSLRQPIMIRHYATPAFDAQNIPNYEQLKSAGKAVIPGSSWMGAIRGRLAVILQDIGTAACWDDAQKILEPVLGTWTKKADRSEKLLASVVKVEESVIRGGHSLCLTRNAIDRFAGGTVSSALYTSLPWVGGNTDLILHWPCKLPQDIINDEEICGLLLWVVRDLQSGLLAVGGETAIGRGILSANMDIMLDGRPLTDSDHYFQAAIDWCKRQNLHVGGDIAFNDGGKK